MYLKHNLLVEVVIVRNTYISGDFLKKIFHSFSKIQICKVPHYNGIFTELPPLFVVLKYMSKWQRNFLNFFFVISILLSIIEPRLWIKSNMVGGT